MRLCSSPCAECFLVERESEAATDVRGSTTLSQAICGTRNGLRHLLVELLHTGPRSSPGGSQPHNSPSCYTPAWDSLAQSFLLLPRKPHAAPFRPHDSDQIGSTQTSNEVLAPSIMGRSGPRPRGHSSKRPVKDLGVQDPPEYNLLHSAAILAGTSPGHRQAPHLQGIDKSFVPRRAPTSASPTLLRHAR
jgi:hypothetical protein